MITEVCELNPATLSKAATTLENAGYMRIRKGHSGRRPRTRLSLTTAGRSAFEGHLAALCRLTEHDQSAGPITMATAGSQTHGVGEHRLGDGDHGGQRLCGGGHQAPPGPGGDSEGPAGRRGPVGDDARRESVWVITQGHSGELHVARADRVFYLGRDTRRRDEPEEDDRADGCRGAGAAGP